MRSYEEMTKVVKALEEAKNWNLLAEVVISSWNHKEQFPDASLTECLQVGLDEWDL